MKKVNLLLLAALVVLGLSACGGASTEATQEAEAVVEEVVTPEAEAEVVDTTSEEAMDDTIVADEVEVMEEEAAE